MKAIKVKIYPSKRKKELIDKHFGCCRFVYNFALEKTVECYQQNKKRLSAFNVMMMLPALREENPWLKEVNAQSLQQSIRDLDSAFSHFFKKNNKFPKFKSKKNSTLSYRVQQKFEVNTEKKYLRLPKLGWIRFKDEFNIPEDIEFRHLTVSKDGDEYFVSITYKTKEEPKLKSIPELNKTLGIDLGIKTLATFSDGTKIENPKHIKKYEDKLKEAQQKLSKKDKSTSSFQRQKKIVHKVYKKIRNTRMDFLHKLTNSIVENQNFTSVSIEDLSTQEMMENSPSPMSKAISDTGWRMFRTMLEYKLEDKGKNLFVIGRFDASSKTCTCGIKNNELTLNDRMWTCKHCGATHDRDILAANNIKVFGFRKFESGQDSAAKAAKASVKSVCQKETETRKLAQKLSKMRKNATKFKLKKLS